MYYSKKDAYGKFFRAIGELVPYSIVRRNLKNTWIFQNRENINPGFRWSPRDFPVHFCRKIMLPYLHEDQELSLRLWFGGESLVKVDGKAYGELNEYHREIDVTEFAGKRILVEVETVPKGLFGSSVESPTFSEAFLIIYDTQIKGFITKLRNVLEVFMYSEDGVLCERLYNVLNRVLSLVKIPRDSANYARGLLDDPAMAREVTSVWKAEDFELAETRSLPESFRRSFLEAGSFLDRELRVIKDSTKAFGEMTLAGHAHIDYAWLWPLSETRRKVRRTFANAVRLSKKYGEFVYSQSSAAMYADIMESDPELFREIKRLILEGRWEAIGGMWVESDTNLVNGESLVRQFLYGQRFFEKHFGKRSRTAWLPDVFGFTWILPQIMKKAGIDFFFTTKIYWSEKNKPQRDLFRWRGIDGSEVIYHSFNNPGNGYNGLLGPKEILTTMKNYKERALHDETIFSFGYGDGGGGPTDEMLDNYRVLRDIPGMPELKMRPFEKFFEDLPEGLELHVHDGELYLELHRGTYTSQGRMKMAHRNAERSLYLAEALGTMTGYDTGKMERLWRTLLHNEFHDILPGSSIREVYEDALGELFELKNEATKMIEGSLSELSDGDAAYLSLFNPSSSPRRVFFSLPRELGLSLETGEKIVAQKLQNGETLYYSDAEIAPMGSIVMKASRSDVIMETASVRQENTLENDLLLVRVDEEGMSIYDKEFSREVFNGKAALMIYKDIPTHWDGWDIEKDYHLTGERLAPSHISRMESGRIRQSLRVVFDLGMTRVIQDITLHVHSRRVDLFNTIDWHMRRTMLRADLPLNVLTRVARYDLSCGYIERPTTVNNYFQEAAFEVPAHRWVDLSEYGYGVSVLNNGKYGHGVRGSTVSLNLLRSPIFPDFFADEGRHEFVYSIYPHGGSDLLGTLREAENINRDLLAIEGRFKIERPFIEIDAPTIGVMTLKLAEEGSGKVLRVAELLGARGRVRIRTAFKFARAWLCNLLEERIEPLATDGENVALDYEPFGIYTVMFEG